FADLIWRDRVAGAGPYDLDDQRFAHDHTLSRLALVGDDAGLGDRVALQHRDAALPELFAQRAGQCRARDQRALERQLPEPGLLGSIDQDLEKVGCADIADRLILRDRRQLLLGIADPAGNDGAA